MHTYIIIQNCVRADSLIIKLYRIEGITLNVSCKQWVPKMSKNMPNELILCNTILSNFMSVKFISSAQIHQRQVG